MRFNFVVAAIIVALCSTVPAIAQNVRDIPAPRETPPAGFKGAQFVDSGGCVFIRAGIDGRVMWVPRVNGARKVLCGYPPTFATAPSEPRVPQIVPVKPSSVVPAIAPAKVPHVPPVQTATVAVPDRGADCPTRAPILRRAPLQGGGTAVLCLSRADLLSAPITVARLEGSTPLPALSAANSGSVLVCPHNAPVPQRLALTGGGATLLCTAGNGSLNGLAVPKRRAAAAAVAVAQVANVRPAEAGAPFAAVDLLRPVVPKGYKLAWQDDRLNARRARGTPEGQQAQDRIWTRETPARLVATATRNVSAFAPRSGYAPLRVSTKGQYAAHYVQVGSFAQPANAQAAVARLTRLGMPVSSGSVTRGGRAIVVVMAGPFAVDAAADALTLTRNSGFADAMLR